MCLFILFFFFIATATTEFYTLSLHDALPILLSSVSGIDSRRDATGDAGSDRDAGHRDEEERDCPARPRVGRAARSDRKSTRLNSSHVSISYAVFCLKKKKKKKQI